MTPHDDERRPDEAKADEVERELDEMCERHEELGGTIDEADEDWGRKKRDDRVPGATGELDEDEDDDEAEDGSAEDLDFGREIESEDVVGEAPSDDADDDDGEAPSDDADEDDADDDDR
jgi:hypothetical protein